jgi:hypothetical protein
MTAVVYQDPFAELVVVGCAIDNDEASRLAHQRVTGDDFDDRQLAALFDITPDLPYIRPDHATDPWQPLLWQQRAAKAAALTGIPETDVLAVCSVRPVMSDTSGHYARRVNAAARARRRRSRLSEAADLLDRGDLHRYTQLLNELVTAETP